MGALVSLAWSTQRTRVKRLGALAVVCLATMAFSTQDALAQATSSGHPWSWAEVVTPANVLAVLTLVFHFGFLVSELRSMKARLDAMTSEFARKDVSDERFRALDHRVDSLEGR